MNVIKIILAVSAFWAMGCSQPSHKLLPKPDASLVQHKVATTISYNNKVDILFVVDDSGSMDRHQTNLIQNIDLFVDEIAKNRILDYHIGVISSSADFYTSGPCQGGLLCGRRAKFVDKTTPYGVDILKENLRLGTDGSPTERFFDPVMLALNAQNTAGHNAGFYRQDAYLALIFLTDAEDQSTATPNDFYQFLLGLKNGDQKKLLGYGAIIPGNDPFQCSRDEERPPLRLEEYFTLMNGLIYNLCEPQFGLELSKVSVDITSKVGRIISLERPPDVETIVLKFGVQTIPNEYDTGWTYDPSINAIVLGQNIKWLDQGPSVKLEVTFDEAKYPVPQAKKKRKLLKR